jgi:hypothetical protein
MDKMKKTKGEYTLFDYLYEQHDLILTESELAEVRHHAEKELQQRNKELEAEVKLLKACREYDASGKNRPDGYIVPDYYTAQRIEENNSK